MGWASVPEVQQSQQRLVAIQPRTISSSNKGRHARPREGGDRKEPCWLVAVVIGPCASGTSRRGESVTPFGLFFPLSSTHSS